MSPDENRALAPLPGFPAKLKDLKIWTGRIDAYLRDHFGFRDTIIELHAWIVHTTSSQAGNAWVLLGSDGWMFYRGDQMLDQSSGRIIRREFVEQTAGVLAEMNTLLAAKGVKLIVASPPNSATIYFDKIRGWPDAVIETEYDLQLALLARRNVTAVDLRPGLREARLQGKTYYPKSGS